MKWTLRIALFQNLPSGGAKRAIYEWVCRLSIKHSIDVYTLDTADHKFCDIRPHVKNYFVYDFKPLRLFHSPLGRLNQLQRIRDLNKLSSIFIQIAKHINSGDYDIVFVHPTLYTLIPDFIYRLDVPSIYYSHEPIGQALVEYQRPYNKANSLKRMMDKVDPLIYQFNREVEQIQGKNIEYFTLLLANSRFTSKVMASAYQINIPVCYLGVDTERFTILPGIHKKNYVVSVGEMSPRKGFDFLINSLGHISANNRPALAIACNMVNTAEWDFIQSLAADAGVELHVYTNLDTYALKLLYNQALFCVYAPIKEPFGLVPLEAMACGIPVVALDEGGVAETVKHEEVGFLTKRDSSQFGKAVEILLKNPFLREQYGRAARSYVLESWTWEESTKALEAYFYQVLMKL